jgi:uncharacterized membrane protein YhaH (DUF805 family)
MSQRSDDPHDRILFFRDNGKPPRSDLWWGILLWCVACAMVAGVAMCWAVTGGPQG